MRCSTCRVKVMAAVARHVWQDVHEQAKEAVGEVPRKPQLQVEGSALAVWVGVLHEITQVLEVDLWGEESVYDACCTRDDKHMV